VTVRSCLPDEAEAVLRLWRDAEAVPSVTDDPASVRALIDHDGDAVLVAEEGGRIVGCLVAGWDGWRGHMYRLAVLPEHRRRGVARALVAEGERRLRARGARRVAAIVVTAHEPAVGFWEAAGYARDRRVGRFVRNVEPA
jgi:ribosomal protein S18 acetylase RimI-like enzyme